MEKQKAQKEADKKKRKRKKRDARLAVKLAELSKLYADKAS